MNPQQRQIVTGIAGIVLCITARDAHAKQVHQNERKTDSRASESQLALVFQMPEDEIVRVSIDDYFETWHKAVSGMPNERKRELALELYLLMKAKGMFWTRHLLAPRPQDFPGLGILFLKDFDDAPSLELPPEEKFGWGARAELLGQQKYVYADAVAKLGDGETMQALWKKFPDMSDSDQRIVSLAVDHTSVSQVESIVDASMSSKSDVVRNNLLAAASRITSHALENPETAAAATQKAEWLKSKGLASEFLIKDMQKHDR